jgi:hypothetical protein
MVAAGATLTKSWDKVSGIEVTLDHAFVAVNGEYGIVVPRRTLGAERFEHLMDNIRRFAKFN